MTPDEFVRLVADMRAAQREYFNPHTRTATTLDRSKALERRVDQAVKDHFQQQQPTLFPRGADADG